MRRIPGLVALASLSLATLGSAPPGLAPPGFGPLTAPAQAQDAPSLVKQAAEQYAKDIRGVVGYRSRTESTISAPMINQTTSSTAFTVQKDGLPVRVVMARMVTNGKEASRDQLKEQEGKTNAAFKGGKGYFKAPYDARHLDDYTFRLEACDDCAAGMTAIRFTSALKDDQHGNGVMILDAAKHVREVRYTPNAYPANVTRGNVLLTRDEVDNRLFGLSGLKLEFHGAMGLLKGSFVMDQRNDAFRRYASVEEALAQAEAQANKP
jgi:hypothetical protein